MTFAIETGRRVPVTQPEVYGEDDAHEQREAGIVVLLRRLKARTPRGTHLRVAAALHLLNPDGRSAVAVAEQHGVSKQCFNRHVSELSRAFGIRLRTIDSPERRRKLTKAMKAWHAKRKGGT